MPSLPSSTRSRRPVRWRLLVVGLLLAALAGWQGWHCADGVTTSPAGLVLTAHHTDSHHGQPGDEALAGVCLSVLAAIAGALSLLATPRWPAAGAAQERRHRLPPRPLLARAPALSALGLLRI